MKNLKAMSLVVITGMLGMSSPIKSIAYLIGIQTAHAEEVASIWDDTEDAETGDGRDPANAKNPGNWQKLYDAGKFKEAAEYARKKSEIYRKAGSFGHSLKWNALPFGTKDANNYSLNLDSKMKAAESAERNRKMELERVKMEAIANKELTELKKKYRP